MEGLEDNMLLDRPDRPSSQRKITKILAAAQTEFFAYGFSASSIEAIAARAQVSKVTIYNWFKTKENLFAEVVKAECKQMQLNMLEGSHDGRGLRSVLMTAGEEMMLFLMREETVRFDRILAAEVNRDPKIGEAFLDNGPRAMIGHLKTLLVAAIERGEIQSDDLQHSAEMFTGLIMGRIDLYLRYGEQIKLTKEQRRARVTRAVDAWMKIHQS